MTHREIDRRIESEIMKRDLASMPSEDVKHYSTDTNRAMLVVKKLHEEGWGGALISYNDALGKWCVSFFKGEDENLLAKYGRHKHLARAICLAAIDE